jgi:c-di-GMP-binding flagellar brake protein YcgR
VEVDAPTVGGKKVAVPPQTRVTLTDYTQSGLTLLETVVGEVKMNPSPVWIIPIPTMQGIRRIQRRIAERFEIDIKLRWRKKDLGGEHEQEPLHLLNISSTGAYIKVSSLLEIGDEIVMDLTPLIQLTGTVILQKIRPSGTIVRKGSDHGFFYGICFAQLERMDKVSLMEALRKIKGNSS